MGDLRLKNNRIVNISALSSMKRIWSLDLSGNFVVNTTPLSTLSTLRFLYLHDNDIVNITALSDMTVLRDLTLCGNRIRNITALGSLNLEWVCLADNEIVNVNPLAGGLTKMKVLNLSNNLIENPTVLSGMSASGDRLYLRDNPFDQARLNGLIAALPNCDVWHGSGTSYCHAVRTFIVH